MRKEFLPYNQVRNNALKLAYKIHNEGFIPDVIYVSLRGGAYLGNVISEYFKLVRKNDRPILYAAVVARSYSDVRENSCVRVDGWTYKPEYLRHGDKVLLVDDIYDTGKTIAHLANLILERGVPRHDLKIAVHDYKISSYHGEQPEIKPDYWCRKHNITSEDDDIWIHYMSHELVGLSQSELTSYYYADDKELKTILSSDIFKK